ITKSLTRLGSWRLGHHLAPRSHAGFDHLQAFTAGLRAHNHLLDIAEQSRSLHFLAEVFENWLDLGIEKNHLAADTTLEKQVGIDGPVQYQRRRHVPIASDLAEPVVFLGSERCRHLDEIVGSLRPEVYQPPVARFAHLGFAAEIIELEN